MVVCNLLGLTLAGPVVVGRRWRSVQALLVPVAGDKMISSSGRIFWANICESRSFSPFVRRDAAPAAALWTARRAFCSWAAWAAENPAIRDNLTYTSLH